MDFLFKMKALKESMKLDFLMDLFLKEISFKVLSKVWVVLIILMETFLKVNIKIILNKILELIDFKMEFCFKVIFKMVSYKEKVI